MFDDIYGLTSTFFCPYGFLTLRACTCDSRLYDISGNLFNVFLLILTVCKVDRKQITLLVLRLIPFPTRFSQSRRG